MIQGFIILHLQLHLRRLQLHLRRLLAPGEPEGVVHVLPVEVAGLARGKLGDVAGDGDQQPQSSGHHPSRAGGE